MNETKEKTILYFVATRWVLLGKVIDRILSTYFDKTFYVVILTNYLDQWNALGEYFLVYLPTNEKAQTLGNAKYDSIKSNLSSHVCKTRLLFVSYLCRSIFDRFLTWFQQEGPLIHLLHQELSDLYRIVLLSFLTPDYVGNKQGAELLKIDFTFAEKQLNSKQLRIGENLNYKLSLPNNISV